MGFCFHLFRVDSNSIFFFNAAVIVRENYFDIINSLERPLLEYFNDRSYFALLLHRTPIDFFRRKLRGSFDMP